MLCILNITICLVCSAMNKNNIEQIWFLFMKTSYLCGDLIEIYEIVFFILFIILVFGEMKFFYAITLKYFSASASETIA